MLVMKEVHAGGCRSAAGGSGGKPSSRRRLPAAELHRLAGAGACVEIRSNSAAIWAGGRIAVDDAGRDGAVAACRRTGPSRPGRM